MEKKVTRTMSSLKLIIGLLVFIAVIHFSALYNYWYWTYQWLDMPMHFLGGFWTALVVFALINNFQFPVSKQSVSGFFSFLIIILSFVALVGVLLEFVEFFYNIQQSGVADTLADLFFDLLGGLAFIFLTFLRKSVYYKQS